MNSRRQFLKKSIFGAILALFAPKLLSKEYKNGGKVIDFDEFPPGIIYYPDSWWSKYYCKDLIFSKNKCVREYIFNSTEIFEEGDLIMHNGHCCLIVHKEPLYKKYINSDGTFTTL